MTRMVFSNNSVVRAGYFSRVFLMYNTARFRRAARFYGPALIFIPYVAYCLNDRFQWHYKRRDEILEERKRKKLSNSEEVT